ncbi:hypothetical protein [Micromonospora avicenniae]|uniref:DUF397 domain-containing protein n=1 Tax=Micromonospora avicenniae TaxID=1198245 RepID=A0A1N7EM23_9ACTN|nr:hypothetical protein [Micromonospora avicenniae]SIR89109.1 hypothetical protein SAMN05444858_1254 [Micromonospora avicenniae]
MSRLNWTPLRCDKSGPNCPEIAMDGDNRYLRDSGNPAYVAKFPVASVGALEQTIRGGEI